LADFVAGVGNNGLGPLGLLLRASSGEDVAGARLDLVVALAEVQGVESREAIDGKHDGLAVERLNRIG